MHRGAGCRWEPALRHLHLDGRHFRDAAGISKESLPDAWELQGVPDLAPQPDAFPGARRGARVRRWAALAALEIADPEQCPRAGLLRVGLEELDEHRPRCRQDAAV